MGLGNSDLLVPFVVVADIAVSHVKVVLGAPVFALSHLKVLAGGAHWTKTPFG